ncbi:hypothetical protein J9A88_21895, partial [Klebsiella pneumoniae]
WRLKQSLGRTWLRRPELLENLALTEEQAKLLAEFKTEHAQQQRKTIWMSGTRHKTKNQR